jgi:hypothetical protein
MRRPAWPPTSANARLPLTQQPIRRRPNLFSWRRFVRLGGRRGRGRRSGWRQIIDGGALDRRAGVSEDVEVGMRVYRLE